MNTTYYWSVQTIDTGLAKSAWSTEQTFTLTSDFTPPTITLNAPSSGLVANQTLDIVFNATVYDDYNLTNVSLYGNWSGWHLNVTNSSGINNTDYLFKANLTEGSWLWGIRACDATSNCRSSNSTFRIDITYPVIALVSPVNGTSQTSSNSITFTYNVSDIAINNCTLYLNGVVNETDTSITVNTSQTFAENVPNGNYNWSVKCADAANNINTTANFSLTVSYTPSETLASTSGGGGSGGGGAVSVAVTKVTRIIAAIAEGNNLIEFAESEKAFVGVEEIMLDSAAAALNVKITIEKLTAMPASIASAPSGEIYTYLQFNKTVLKDEDVKEAKITFSVGKDWVTRNMYDYNKIVLQRYTTKWDALPTTYLKQNASNYYYEASTPGFSVFAITAEKKQEEQPITAEKQNKIQEKPVIPAEGAPAKQEEPRKKLIGYVFSVLIATAIIALIIILGLKRKKNLKK
ncbi:MAG: PGF-pre-PGF domain-containing protein [Candidatus Nanoarchaeia archaeon]